MMADKKGSLIIVGTGIMVGSQTTLSAKTHIEQAEVVFAAVAGEIGMHWVKSLNANVISLGDLYQEGKSRVITYRQMVDVIAEGVYQGKRVCAALYGHPGVFAYAGHKVIERLRAQGYQAQMDPGISAENCLVADLGIDPATNGCLALDATQFLFYQHTINPHCLLILWQVGLTGDYQFLSQEVDQTSPGLTILTAELLNYYPPDHQVIIYEASMMAIEAPRIERMPLSALPQCQLSALSTLVIPSIGLPAFNHRVLNQFGITAQLLQKNLDGLLADPIS